MHLFLKSLLGPARVLLFAFLLTEQVAQGRWDLVPGSRYTSSRAAALGDATLPLGEDGASGLFYNPSTLAKPTVSALELLNISLYGNVNYLQNINGDFYKVTNLSGFLPTLQKNPGNFS